MARVDRAIPGYKGWLTIGFGELVIIKSPAQVTDLYDPKRLAGRQVGVVVNFPPRRIASFFSECLVPGVYTDKKGLVLLGPERKVENGWKVG